MSRVKRGVTAWTRRKKVISAAKGFHDRHNNVYRIAKQAVMRADQYTYRDRRNEKRVLHALWVARVDADAREHDLTYNRFMNGLKKASIELGHKVLPDMTVHDKVTFAAIVDQVKTNAT